MAFMMGMYWCARSVDGDAEIKRIRDCREDAADPGSVDASRPVAPPPVLDAAALVLLPMSDSAWEMDSRLICDKARVSAPAIMVDVLLETEVGVVVLRRVVRFWMSSCSTRRKGLYLLPSEVEVVSSVFKGDGFVGGLRFNLRRLDGSKSSFRSPSLFCRCGRCDRGGFCSVGDGYNH